MSMSDANKRNIMNLGGDVHLLPLLTHADNLTRWSARQVGEFGQSDTCSAQNAVQELSVTFSMSRCILASCCLLLIGPLGHEQPACMCWPMTWQTCPAHVSWQCPLKDKLLQGQAYPMACAPWLALSDKLTKSEHCRLCCIWRCCQSIQSCSRRMGYQTTFQALTLPGLPSGL